MKKYLFVFYVLLVRDFNLGKRYTKFMTLLWVHKFICWLVTWKFLTGLRIINCPITTWHHTKDWKDTEQLPREDTIIKLTIGFFTQRSHSMTYSRRVSVRIKQLLFWEINIHIFSRKRSCLLHYAIVICLFKTCWQIILKRRLFFFVCINR